jgi:hypothetical protein
MATYKKGFKKQNSEMLLLKTIVAIILAVVAMVMIAFIYDSVTKWKNYNNYTDIGKYEDVFNLKDEEEQAIGNYVVYVYSDTCEACATIRNDLLRLANRMNKQSEVFFLLNTSKATGESDDLLETIERTQILTPMLIVVVDGEFEEVFVSSTNVLNAIESIEKGTYEPFN